MATDDGGSKQPDGAKEKAPATPNLTALAGIVSAAVVAVSALLGPVTTMMTATENRRAASLQHQASMKLEFIEKVLQTKGDPTGRADVLHYYSRVLEDPDVKAWAKEKLDEVDNYKKALEKVADLEAKLKNAQAQVVVEDNPDKVRQLVAKAEETQKQLIEAKVVESTAARAFDVPTARDVTADELPLKMTVLPSGFDASGNPMWSVRIALVGGSEFFDQIQEVEYFISGGDPETKIKKEREDNFALEYGATHCKSLVPITVRGKDGSVRKRALNMCNHPAWVYRARDEVDSAQVQKPDFRRPLAR